MILKYTSTVVSRHGVTTSGQPKRYKDLEQVNRIFEFRVFTLPRKAGLKFLLLLVILSGIQLSGFRTHKHKTFVVKHLYEFTL